MPGKEEYFDYDYCTVRHLRGRVERPFSNKGLGGLYVVGWLKRGPSGIIGTNMLDAKETVASILEDLEHFDSSTKWKGNVSALLKDNGFQVIGFFQVIDWMVI